MALSSKRADQDAESKPPGEKGQESEDLLQRLARLVLRHEDNINALVADVAFVSFAKCPDHTVLPALFEASKAWKDDNTLSPSLRSHTVKKFFEVLQERIWKFEGDQGSKEQLRSQGLYTAEGKWHYIMWSASSKQMVATDKPPINAEDLKNMLSTIISLIEREASVVSI